jgi:type IV pilus assembly protein PilQ
LAARLISKLDIRTQEVLIEAFIVEADDDCQYEFSSRFGYRNSAGNGTSTNPLSAIGGMVGDVANANIFSRPITGALFGLGYLFQTTAYQLKVELTAMEKLSIVKIVSNHHVFSMDNEEAVVIDEMQIPYPVPGVGTNQITY